MALLFFTVHTVHQTPLMVIVTVNYIDVRGINRTTILPSYTNWLLSLSWDSGCLGLTWGVGYADPPRHSFHLTNTVRRERRIDCDEIA